MPYIYKISNDVNGLVYVGQTVFSVNERLKEHIYDSKRDNSEFHKAIRDIGEEHFKIEILEECPIERLNEREVFWISYYNSFYCGYNSTHGGQGSIITANPDYCLKYYLENRDSKTLTEIIKDLGCQGNNLREFLQEKGAREKQQYHKLSDISDEFIAEIKQMIKEGSSRSQVCAKLHLDHRSLSKICENNGITFPESQFKPARPIYQLSLDGEIIKEWPSIFSAEKELKNHHIGECVIHKRKTAAGFRWIAKDEI